MTFGSYVFTFLLLQISCFENSFISFQQKAVFGIPKLFAFNPNIWNFDPDPNPEFRYRYWDLVGIVGILIPKPDLWLSVNPLVPTAPLVARLSL